MTIGVIKNHSVSSTVRLHKIVFLLLKLGLPLTPLTLALLFYFFVLTDMHFEEDSISFFSICVLFACICGFIVESIAVNVTTFCCSLDVDMNYVPANSDFTLDFKWFERSLGAVYVCFLIIFALSRSNFIFWGPMPTLFPMSALQIALRPENLPNWADAYVPTTDRRAAEPLHESFIGKPAWVISTWRLKRAVDLLVTGRSFSSSPF